MNDYIEFELNNRKLKIHRENSEDIWIYNEYHGKRLIKNPHWRKLGVYIEPQNYSRCEIYNNSKSKKKYRIHRIVYYAHNQDWDIYNKPRKNPIDHEDNNRQNNHISNLRLATSSLNNQNRIDVKGYHWDKKKQRYRVSIKNPNKKHQTYIGLYKTEEEARQAYLDAKKIHHEW